MSGSRGARTSSSNSRPSAVQTLVDMGFDREKATKAMQAADFVVDRALEILIRNKEPRPPPPPYSEQGTAPTGPPPPYPTPPPRPTAPPTPKGGSFNVVSGLEKFFTDICNNAKPKQETTSRRPEAFSFHGRTSAPTQSVQGGRRSTPPPRNEPSIIFQFFVPPVPTSTSSSGERRRAVKVTSGDAQPPPTMNILTPDSVIIKDDGIRVRGSEVLLLHATLVSSSVLSLLPVLGPYLLLPQYVYRGIIWMPYHHYQLSPVFHPMVAPPPRRTAGIPSLASIRCYPPFTRPQNRRPTYSPGPKNAAKEAPLEVSAPHSSGRSSPFEIDDNDSDGIRVRSSNDSPHPRAYPVLDELHVDEETAELDDKAAKESGSTASSDAGSVGSTHSVPITVTNGTPSAPPPSHPSPTPNPSNNSNGMQSNNSGPTPSRVVPVQMVRNRSIDDFNEQIVNMLDDVERRVEQLRESAGLLEQEKESIIDMLASFNLNTELLRLGQGDREDINATANRLMSRTRAVDVVVNTPRNDEQTKALSQVNNLIEGVITKMSDDLDNCKDMCRRFLNACSPDMPDGPIDQRFQANVIECTADDQKKIRRKLAQIITQIERAERTCMPQW